jgi:hypothetical protein
MQPLTALGRYLQLQYELEQTGTPAMATALEWRFHGFLKQTVKDPRKGWITAKRHTGTATLRVETAGEPPFELTDTFYLHRDNWSHGETVPVLFDPNDHSRLTIDERDESVQGAAARNVGQASNEAAIELSEQRPGPAAPVASSGAGIQPPAAPDRAAELEQLARLHSSGALTDAEFGSARAKILG